MTARSLDAKIDAKVNEMKKADTGSDFGSLFGGSSLFAGSSLFPSGSLFATPSTTGGSSDIFGGSSLFGSSPLFSSSLFPTTSAYTPSFSVTTAPPKPKEEDKKDFDARVAKIMADMTKKEEENKKAQEAGGAPSSAFGGLFGGSSIFGSSSLFAPTGLLAPTSSTPAPDTGTKAFETRMKDTLGGSSLLGSTSSSTPLTTTPAPAGGSSLFGAGLFAGSSLFSPGFLSTPTAPAVKSEEEKKKEFDDRMKNIFGKPPGPADSKATDVASTSLGSFSSILNLSIVPEKKEKSEAEKKKEFDDRMASIFGKKPDPVAETKTVEKVETEEEKKKKNRRADEKNVGWFRFYTFHTHWPSHSGTRGEENLGSSFNRGRKEKKNSMIRWKKLCVSS